MSRKPVDACHEGASRLNVLISLLERHQCLGEEPKEDPKTSIDGYDLSIVMEAMESVRDMLRESADADGGAR